MTRRDHYLAGTELRVLVDAACMQPRPDGRRKTATNTRGWFIAIDLAKPGPLKDRSRVIGPLWSTDGAQSLLSFTDGVRFTEADVAAGKARPQMTFDGTGRLVRQIRIPVTPAANATPGTPASVLVVESCDTSTSPGKWTKISDAAPIGTVGADPYEGRVTSLAGHTLVQEETDGKVRAYDLFTGAPRTDAWLTESFADLRSRKDFHNTRTWLTEDLKFLVSNPAERHNDNGVMIEQFVFEGAKYSREDYGLVYTRPEIKPALFRKPKSDALFLIKPPVDAFAIGGDLLLLDSDESAFKLFSIDGKVHYEWTKHENLKWSAGFKPWRQLDAAADRLVFFGVDDPDHRVYRDEHLPFLIWDYKAGKLRRETVELSDLFDVKDGNYVPK